MVDKSDLQNGSTLGVAITPPEPKQDFVATNRKDQPESPPSVAMQPITRKGGIGMKVIVLMLLVSLLPGGLYFALSFKQTNERLISETNSTGTLVSGLLATEVDEWIDKNVRALNTIAKIPAFTSMNNVEQEMVLRSLQGEYPWMYLAFTTDIRGMNVARSDGKSLKDYSNRQYVKDIVEGKTLAWQNLIGKTSKKPALVIAVPIVNGESIVGVLAAAMTRDVLSKLVTTYVPGNTGSSFLVDEKGKTVAHRNNSYVLSSQDMSNHPLIMASGQGQSTRVAFLDANNRETIGFAKKTKLGWTLAIQQEKSEAFAPLKKAQYSALTLFAGTILVIIIISFFASKAIVSPVRELTDAANRISVGELDVEITNTSKDEIGALADAVRRMQDSIRLSIQRLQRKRSV